MNTSDTKKARAMLTLSRVLVYLVLIFLSVLCLFSFYMTADSSSVSLPVFLRMSSGMLILPMSWSRPAV